MQDNPAGTVVGRTAGLAVLRSIVVVDIVAVVVDEQGIPCDTR